MCTCMRICCDCASAHHQLTISPSVSGAALFLGRRSSAHCVCLIALVYLRLCFFEAQTVKKTLRTLCLNESTLVLCAANWAVTNISDAKFDEAWKEGTKVCGHVGQGRYW